MTRTKKATPHTRKTVAKKSAPLSRKPVRLRLLSVRVTPTRTRRAVNALAAVAGEVGVPLRTQARLAVLRQATDLGVTLSRKQLRTSIDRAERELRAAMKDGHLPNQTPFPVSEALDKAHDGTFGDRRHDKTRIEHRDAQPVAQYTRATAPMPVTQPIASGAIASSFGDLESVIYRVGQRVIELHERLYPGLAPAVNNIGGGATTSSEAPTPTRIEARLDQAARVVSALDDTLLSMLANLQL